MYSDTTPMSNDIDFKKYITELKTPWKTMGPDIDTALDIISKHAKTDTDIGDLELISVSDKGHEAEISFPDWQNELEKVFIHQYGLNDGRQIFKKVVMRLFLLSRGTAQQVH